MYHFKTVLLCASAVGLLAACGSNPSMQASASASSDRIDVALQRAAAKGSQQESLPFLETLYTRNHNDPIAATNLASALHNSGQVQKAAIILAPFMRDADGPSVVKTQYAAIQLTLGNYRAAEDFAAAAIAQDSVDYEAYHYLGIAQDAQGLHTEAEQSLRTALDNNTGDPVPVMNNLALNLAAQQRADEALDIIARASALAPHRREVENNRRIIHGLLQNHMMSKAPKPAKKPA